MNLKKCSCVIRSSYRLLCACIIAMKVHQKRDIRLGTKRGCISRLMMMLKKVMEMIVM